MNPELKAMLPDERRRNAAEVGGNRTARIDFTPEELAEFAALIAERCADELTLSYKGCMNEDEQSGHHLAALWLRQEIATRWRSFPPKEG